MPLLEKEYEKIRAEELKKAKTKINSRKKYYEDLGAHITSLEVLNTEKYVKEYTYVCVYVCVCIYIYIYIILLYSRN